ncbi:metallophosphoesterase [Nocardiopsis alba]|uniref:metallophosphoesterase n=1 Tax=Nocardiopsis alba TaxID=53437 RepID=UPI0033AE6B26
MSALIAHISDLHLDGTEETTRRATRTVDHLRSLHRSPDLLVVSGDIADHGAPEEYEQAAALLDLPFPVLVCPGNHDDRAALRSGLLGQDPSDGPVDTEHRGTGFTVLACDTSIPGRDDGHLGTETLERVRRTLDELPEDIPVLLAMHHPPRCACTTRSPTGWRSTTSRTWSPCWRSIRVSSASWPGTPTPGPPPLWPAAPSWWPPASPPR